MFEVPLTSLTFLRFGLRLFKHAGLVPYKYLLGPNSVAPKALRRYDRHSEARVRGTERPCIYPKQKRDYRDIRIWKSACCCSIEFEINQEASKFRTSLGSPEHKCVVAPLDISTLVQKHSLCVEDGIASVEAVRNSEANATQRPSTTRGVAERRAQMLRS